MVDFYANVGEGSRRGRAKKGEDHLDRRFEVPKVVVKIEREALKVWRSDEAVWGKQCAKKG